jgi:hypothetical protein
MLRPPTTAVRWLLRELGGVPPTAGRSQRFCHTSYTTSWLPSAASTTPFALRPPKMTSQSPTAFIVCHARGVGGTQPWSAMRRSVLQLLAGAETGGGVKRRTGRG